MTANRRPQNALEKCAACEPVVIKHNLDPSAFKWLWAKYVIEPNLSQHCTACLRAEMIQAPSGRGGSYSRKLSRASNPTLETDRIISMNECTSGISRPIYICGVSANGVQFQAKLRAQFACSDFAHSWRDRRIPLRRLDPINHQWPVHSNTDRGRTPGVF